MTVYFALILNNTSKSLDYWNSDTGYRVTVKPKTDQYENDDGWIPASNYHADRVPEQSSGKFIKIWYNGDDSDHRSTYITDDNWMFSFRGNFSEHGSGDRETKRHGSLKSTASYVLRVDEVDYEGHKRAGYTVYEYEDRHGATPGYITVKLIQEAAIIVGLVLMAIFL